MRASAVSWQQRAMLLTSGTRVSGLAWWTTAALVAVSVAQLALFGLTALLRLGYPYPLEPSEPASLAEVQRILMGQPLYVEPSLGYVPLVYGPIYFSLSAAVAALLGPTFLPLRLVSLIASVGCIALVYAIVRRETASRVASLASAALLAAANPLMETALDIGRVDSVFTLLILLGAYLARGATLPTQQRSRRQLAVLGVAGICFGLAAVTKSPLAAVPSMGAVLVFLVVYERVRASAFALGVTAAAGFAATSRNRRSATSRCWTTCTLRKAVAPIFDAARIRRLHPCVGGALDLIERPGDALGGARCVCSLTAPRCLKAPP